MCSVHDGEVVVCTCIDTCTPNTTAPYITVKNLPMGLKCKDIGGCLVKCADILKHHIDRKVLHCTSVAVPDDTLCPCGAWCGERDEQEAGLQQETGYSNGVGEEDDAGDQPQDVEEQAPSPKTNGTGCTEMAV